MSAQEEERLGMVREINKKITLAQSSQEARDQRETCKMHT